MIIIATWGYTDSMCEDIHPSTPPQIQTNKQKTLRCLQLILIPGLLSEKVNNAVIFDSPFSLSF